jgi:hypothetical protein
LPQLKNSLFAAIHPFLTLARQWAHRHSKGVTGVVAALTLFSGGAYAVASVVVSLGPDVAQLPVREVSETVTPLPLQAQAEQLDAHRFNLYRSTVTRATDTA